MHLKLAGRIITISAIALIVVLLILVLTHQVVFNGPLPGTGDPGNKRLNELANDPVFSALPPNASLSGPIIKTPAQYRHSTFETSGWNGPSVEVIFVSKEPKAKIYQFYAAQAADTGWDAGNKNSDGYTRTWTKTYPDKVDAGLILYTLDDNPNVRRYDLVGSISAIDTP
jgi:hypothetical protein